MDNEKLASLIRGLQQWRNKRAARPSSSDRANLDKRIADYETAIFRTELARSLRALNSDTPTRGRTVGRNDR